MVGPIVHFGQERMSNKLSVNSNAKLNKTALLHDTVFAKTNLMIVFSSHLRTFVLKIFSGSNHGGPYSGDWIQENV